MRTALKLLQAHNHAGKDCLPGEVIEVDDDLAEWLVDIGVAKEFQGNFEVSTDSQSEPLAETGSSQIPKEKRK